MDNMYLNFLPLEDSKFSIPLYRKQVVNNEKKPDGTNRFRLKAESSNDYDLFDVCWSEREGFDYYNAYSMENRDLTKQYIIRCLDERLKALNLIEWYSPTKSFYKELRFIVGKYNEGQREIRLIPYFFPNNIEFGFLLQHHFKVNTEQVFNREVQKLSLSLDGKYQQNRNFYIDTYKYIQTFIEKVINNIGPLGSGVVLSTNLSLAPTDQLATKQYVVGGGKFSNSQYAGIKQNGPFQGVSESIKYLFVFTEPMRSLARDVYSGLDGKLYSGMFSGLHDMFGLQFGKANVEHQLIDGYTEQAIAQVSQRSIALQEGGKYKVCTLAFLPASMSEELNHEVYSHLKLKAIEGGFYTQAIKQETMGKKDQLKWSIANIGLQIFSKLGGIPWLLKPSHAKCLIFGIGSAHEVDEEGNVKKYTAYSVCIDTRGNFNKIQPLSSSKDRDRYLSDLKAELIRALSEAGSSDIDECVIHLPYKIERNEIDAIKASVDQLRGGVNFRIRIIKINTQHKFFGFSHHNTKVPHESTLVQLSLKEFLIWTEGLQYGKESVSKRVSEPLHIEFLCGSIEDYDEAKTYLQDIINLTGANWRGFNSKAQPISIYYSTLIAKFMKRFEMYESVNDFSVLSQESFNPWFL